jgi:hypothetical protein
MAKPVQLPKTLENRFKKVILATTAIYEWEWVESDSEVGVLVGVSPSLYRSWEDFEDIDGLVDLLANQFQKYFSSVEYGATVAGDMHSYFTLECKKELIPDRVY